MEFSIKTALHLTIWLGVDSSVPHFLDSIEERGEDSGEGEEISLQLDTLTEELVKHWQAGLRDGFRILSELGCVYFTLHSDTILIKISELFSVFWRSSILKLGSVLNNYQI